MLGYGGELVKVYEAVAVQVGIPEGLLDDCHQFFLLQVRAGHQPQRLEELLPLDEPVTSQIVHLECDYPQS